MRNFLPWSDFFFFFFFQISFSRRSWWNYYCVTNLVCLLLDLSTQWEETECCFCKALSRWPYNLSSKLEHFSEWRGSTNDYSETVGLYQDWPRQRGHRVPSSLCQHPPSPSLLRRQSWQCQRRQAHHAMWIVSFTRKQV